MNTLKAIFWDYPGLASPPELKAFIEDNKTQPRVFRWLLRRFLENGRAVDALSYFNLQEIASQLPGLNLSSYSRRKWLRIVEVYGRTKGKQGILCFASAKASAAEAPHPSGGASPLSGITRTCCRR